MAKVKLNPLFHTIQGELNGYIFRSSPDGTTIVSKAPDLSDVQWTEAQKSHRTRFKEAVAYAQAAMADPHVRAHYEQQAGTLNKPPHNLAVSDYFKGTNLLRNEQDLASFDPSI